MGAPKNTGKYAKSWRVKKAYESPQDIRVVIHSAKQYRLAHLLEYGHVLKDRRGRPIGVAEAKPHIRPAELHAEKELMKKVKVRVRGGNS